MRGKPENCSHGQTLEDAASGWDVLAAVEISYVGQTTSLERASAGWGHAEIDIGFRPFLNRRSGRPAFGTCQVSRVVGKDGLR